MDIDHFPQSWEYKIWGSGQITAMQAEAVAHRVYKPPHHNFWFGVLGSDERHPPASLIWRQVVHWGSILCTMPGTELSHAEPGDLDPRAVENAMALFLRALPVSPLKATAVADKDRKKLWRQVQEVIGRLGEFAVELDLIALPPLTYNPADPATFAEAIGNKLLVQEAMPFGEVQHRPFYGSGIYALYYHGDFDAYQPIKHTGTPIYAGRAQPSMRSATTPREQGTPLWGRLKEHADSINEAKNLDIKDFSCRYLVVSSGWEDGAEAHLIHLFQPIWNKEMKICQGLGKHGDKSDTRRNLRSAWDTLHPGRPWADDALPNKRSVEEIKADVSKHYLTHPPRF